MKMVKSAVVPTPINTDVMGHIQQPQLCSAKEKKLQNMSTRRAREVKELLET